MKMIYIKKIINQDIERTPTFNIESIHDFFKINLDYGQQILKKIILIPSNEKFDVKFQKRQTRDEYRVFLNDLFQKIDPSEGDILLFRKSNQDGYLCEHIKSNNISYDHLNHLFEERSNHQLIINDIDKNIIENQSTHINLLDKFVSWFIKLDGDKHNYFTDSFSKNKEKFKAELITYENIYENEFNTKVFTTYEGEIINLIEQITVNIEKKEGAFFKYSERKSNHMPRAILGKNNYLKFLKEISNTTLISQIEFNVDSFDKTTKEAGLHFSTQLIQRFVASLFTKPFVILSGLSGSGKTKLAQAFVQWICQDENQYRIIPVGADWTNREPLLGFPNALNPKEYVRPESGVLDLIIQANKFQELPHFLILDEMNLSHVERYFADFLSVMESKEEIPLFVGRKVENEVPSKLKVPSNLFIIGTVNIDETTNMFSPKVLDRANTIEFRVKQDEMKSFLNNLKDIDMDILKGKGTGMAKSFLDMSRIKDFTLDSQINNALLQFFDELKKAGAEFGFRSATEILRLIYQLSSLDSNLTINQKIDIAIMQKLLPKLHGSRRKLCPVLETLGSFCITIDLKIVKDVFEKTNFDFNSNSVIYPLSLEKITRMYRGAVDNGFASFAEA